MNSSDAGMLFLSVFFFFLGLASIYAGMKKKKQILEAASAASEKIRNMARNDAAQIVEEAKKQAVVIEARMERLGAAEKELIERLNGIRSRLETMTDVAGEQAASIDFVTEEDLLTSEEYQQDRNRVKSKLKSLATDAVKNVRGINSDVNIGKYVGISAKSDLAGALLLTTTEMLCAKLTANNGHATHEKLREVITATAALLKGFDSRAELSPEFVEALEERLAIEIDLKRAKQVAKDRQRELRAEQKEEERVRKEAQKAEEKALYEAEVKRQALAELEAKMLEETEEQRALHAQELEALRAELAEAQSRAERAKSRAQETKQGHVYIISNIGSFGTDVLKIGMTRRLNPIDRVRELGDASVPFSFDVHALIECDDAPALESELHRLFDSRRVNKVNRRKEFFRVSIDEIQSKLEEEGHNALVIPVPSADEHYESLRLERAQKVYADAAAASPREDQ